MKTARTVIAAFFAAADEEAGGLSWGELLVVGHHLFGGLAQRVGRWDGLLSSSAGLLSIHRFLLSRFGCYYYNI